MAPLLPERDGSKWNCKVPFRVLDTPMKSIVPMGMMSSLRFTWKTCGWEVLNAAKKIVYASGAATPEISKDDWVMLT